MKLIKVYRYIRKQNNKDTPYEDYDRVLFDAVVLPDEGSISTSLGPDEEFEIWVDDID